VNPVKLYGFWRSLATYRVRVYGECMKLDAFAKAHPSKQPEAPQSMVTK